MKTGKNKSFADRVLYEMKDHFQFEGEVKFFQGRDLNQLSCIFLSRSEYFGTPLKDSRDGIESISFFRTQRRIAFWFHEEQFIYEQDLRGNWRLISYNDACSNEINELDEINIRELRRELEEFLKANSNLVGKVKKKVI